MVNQFVGTTGEVYLEIVERCNDSDRPATITLISSRKSELKDSDL